MSGAHPSIDPDEVRHARDTAMVLLWGVRRDVELARRAIEAAIESEPATRARLPYSVACAVIEHVTDVDRRATAAASTDAALTAWRGRGDRAAFTVDACFEIIWQVAGVPELVLDRHQLAAFDCALSDHLAVYAARLP